MTPPQPEELDAWWGSCSIKSILPGVLVSLAASLCVVGAAWLFPRGSLTQLIILAPLGLCWVGLLLFWGYRVFGLNYRLTTCRLFVETGLRHRQLQTVELSKVSRVACKSNALEKLLGIGRVFVDVHDSAPPQVILRGVTGPEQVAARIRELARLAATRSGAR